MNLNIFSDLRKPGLVPGESLSLSAKIYSVLEKYPWFYMVPVTFYVANNDGCVLLSCKTTLVLWLIQPWSRLDYLPPQASLITSTMDHPKKRKLTSLKIHWSKQEVSDQRQEPPSKASTSSSRNTVQKPNSSIAITSKEQILPKYPEVFEEISWFTIPHTGVIKPVKEATPWINSFILIEG